MATESSAWSRERLHLSGVTWERTQAPSGGGGGGRAGPSVPTTSSTIRSPHLHHRHSAAASGGGGEAPAALQCAAPRPRHPQQRGAQAEAEVVRHRRMSGGGSAVEQPCAKLEPWGGPSAVRVTLSIPRDAALRLRQLAQDGSQLLRALGVLGVQLDGDQGPVALRLAPRHDPQHLQQHQQHQELLHRTQHADGGECSSSSSGSGGAINPAAISRTAGGPGMGGGGLGDMLSGLLSAPGGPHASAPPPASPSPQARLQLPPGAPAAALARLAPQSPSPQPEKVQFKSPNVVCPPDSVVPRPQAPAQARAAGPFPFTSMNQALHSGAFAAPKPRLVKPPAQQQQQQPQPQMPPPPPPPPPYPTTTMSSPLLVNLLQNDSGAPGAGAGAGGAQPQRPRRLDAASPAPLLPPPSPAAPTVTSPSALANSPLSRPQPQLPPGIYSKQAASAFLQPQSPAGPQPPLLLHHPRLQHQQHHQPQQQQQPQLPAKPVPQSVPMAAAAGATPAVAVPASAAPSASSLLDPFRLDGAPPPHPLEGLRLAAAAAAASADPHPLDTHRIDPSVIDAHAQRIQPDAVLDQQLLDLQTLDIHALDTHAIDPSVIDHHLDMRNLRPPPPPYSEAVARSWQSFMDMTTPALPDLKADDLDEILPSLEDLESDLPEDLLSTSPINLPPPQAPPPPPPHPQPQPRPPPPQQPLHPLQHPQPPPQQPQHLPHTPTASDRRHFLINPLTGELEPHSGGESEADEVRDVFKGLEESPPRLSDEDSGSTIRNEAVTDHSDSDSRSQLIMPVVETGKVARIKNKVREKGRDSPTILKPMEKIKLRLKLEKTEPPSPAYKVDVSFIGAQPKKAASSGGLLSASGSPSGSASSAVSSSSSMSPAEGGGELRVPPLHISLKGRNHVITNKKKTKAPGEKTNKARRAQQDHPAKMKKFEVPDEDSLLAAAGLDGLMGAEPGLLLSDQLKSKSSQFLEMKKAKKLKLNHHDQLAGKELLQHHPQQHQQHVQHHHQLQQQYQHQQQQLQQQQQQQQQANNSLLNSSGGGTGGPMSSAAAAAAAAHLALSEAMLMKGRLPDPPPYKERQDPPPPYKERQEEAPAPPPPPPYKERRGSDSELVRAAAAEGRYAEANGVLTADERRRRLSQQEVLQDPGEPPTSVPGSTNIGTIGALPHKVRKEKLKQTKDPFKAMLKEAGARSAQSKNHSLSKQLAAAAAAAAAAHAASAGDGRNKQVLSLPTGDVDMEAKFKQRLLEGSGPAHRTEAVHQVATAPVAVPSPPSALSLSRRPDRVNTPPRQPEDRAPPVARPVMMISTGASSANTLTDKARVSTSVSSSMTDKVRMSTSVSSISTSVSSTLTDKNSSSGGGERETKLNCNSSGNVVEGGASATTVNNNCSTGVSSAGGVGVIGAPVSSGGNCAMSNMNSLNGMNSVVTTTVGHSNGGGSGGSVGGSSVSSATSGGTREGEDSGIESMDALSEKSPNQVGQSPPADTISAKTQVPDMLDIEAQLAKMEGQCCDPDPSPAAVVSASSSSAAASCVAAVSAAAKTTCGEELEPLPVRVAPPLYTYSNPDKAAARSSETPPLSDVDDDDDEDEEVDEDSNSCGMGGGDAATNNNASSAVVGGGGNSAISAALSKSKSLLEQLLIEIPEQQQQHQQASGGHGGVNQPAAVESPTTRSVRTRAASKLGSPADEPAPPVVVVKATVGRPKRKRLESEGTTTPGSGDDAASVGVRTKKLALSSATSNNNTLKKDGADLPSEHLVKTCLPMAVDVKMNNNQQQQHQTTAAATGGKKSRPGSPTSGKAQDESSDSDEPLMEKVRKTTGNSVSGPVAAAPAAPAPTRAGGKVKPAGATHPAATALHAKNSISTRRSTRAAIPAQNTRSKGEPDVARRKTRSAASEVDKRKKEVK